MRSKVAKSRSSKNLRKSKNRVGSKRRTRNSRNRVGSKRKTKNSKNRRVSRSKRVRRGGADFCEGQIFSENKALIDFLSNKFIEESQEVNGLTEPVFSENFKKIVKAFLEQTKNLLPCNKLSQKDGMSMVLQGHGKSITMKDVLEDLLKGEDTFNNPERLFYLAEYTSELKSKLEEIKEKQNEVYQKQNEVYQKKRTRYHLRSATTIDPHLTAENQKLQVQKEIDTLKEKINTLNNEINTLKEKINTLDNEIDTLKRKIKTIEAVKNDGTAQEVSVGDGGSVDFFELYHTEPINVEGLDKEYFIVMKSRSFTPLNN